MSLSRLSLATLAICALASSAALADTVSPTKANGDFINGSGIPADNFTIAGSATDGTVALKARNRDTGEPLSQSGNVYTVSPGMSVDSPTNPNLTFDFQFTPGTTPLNNYGLKLEVDFDPSAGTDFATVDMNVLGGAGTWQATDGYKANPGSNAWSNNTTPYVYSQSWNLGFSFWNTVYGKSYNPNAAGTYDIRLTAYDPTNSRTVATTSIQAVVAPVPVPAAAWTGLSVLGALGLFAKVRSRRRSQVA